MPDLCMKIAKNENFASNSRINSYSHLYSCALSSLHSFISQKIKVSPASYSTTSPQKIIYITLFVIGVDIIINDSSIVCHRIILLIRCTVPQFAGKFAAFGEHIKCIEYILHTESLFGMWANSRTSKTSNRLEYRTTQWP